MKYATLLILALATAGCYTPPKTGNPAVAVPGAPRQYAPRAAAALAFDPPIALAGPMIDLSREGRAGEAFVGYEQSRIETGYVYQRDQIRSISSFGDNRFERTAYSTRFNTIAR